MKKIQCPCCRNFTHTSDYYLFEICQVCFWQYEESANDKPNINIGGANKISLNQARNNYIKYGVCELEFINNVRKPLPEELSENNMKD